MVLVPMVLAAILFAQTAADIPQLIKDVSAGDFREPWRPEPAVCATAHKVTAAVHPEMGFASARLTLDLRDDLPLEWPVARIDRAWVTFGFDANLGLAARIAVDGMLHLMEREHGIDRSDALPLCSVVVDLHVTQVVNDVLGVHAILRDDAFAR